MWPIRVSTPSEWAAACSDAFVPLQVRSVETDFRASLAQRRLSSRVALTRVTSGASEVMRDHRTIVENPRDSVLLSLHRAGNGRVSQNGRTARLTPGGAAMYDTSTPYVLGFPARMSEIVLEIPRDSIALSTAALADRTARLLADGPELRMLHALSAAASFEHSDVLALEAEVLAGALADLTARLLRSDDTRSALADDAVLLASMRTWIAERHAEADLDPARVAAAHHISLRLAQKLFAGADDSIAASIRRARLATAHRLLRAGHRVQAASIRSGFSDVDTFSRAFRREYGISPSSLRHAE